MYAKALHVLKNKQHVVLARVIRLSGSGPRSVGAACMVLSNGQMMGTVGGGILEYQVHEAAKQAMVNQESRLFQLAMQGEDVTASQMICGGEIAVYIEPLSSENPEIMAVLNLLTRIEKTGTAAGIITRIAPGTPADQTGQRMAVTADGETAGGLDIPAPLLIEAHAGMPRLVSNGVSSDYDLFVEPVLQPDQAVIFGGGHISTCLAPLLKKVGFCVVVVDDRREYANSRRFPDADQIHCISFEDVFSSIQVTPSSYLVIVTRGHCHDAAALAQSLGHPAAYIGMIGSRRKKEAIYARLAADGVGQDRLNAVYSPIGIDILSETPEEIAISIVAQMIRVRAEKRKSRIHHES